MARGKPKQSALTPAELAVSIRLRELWDSRARDLGLKHEIAGAMMKDAENPEGISQAGVSHFLNQRKPISLTRLLWFAEVLRVSPFDIDADLATKLPASAARALRSIQTQPVGSNSNFYAMHRPHPIHINETK